jgi:hypothetical protein
VSLKFDLLSVLFKNLSKSFRMVNAHGGVSKLSSVPIIIQTGNKTGAIPSQTNVQSLVLNPSGILLNSQGQTFKVN